MKNYIGIAFNIVWIFIYMKFFYPEELGLMILWFILWIFLVLPWGIISIGGLIDDNDKKIKSLLFNTKLGRYFVFIWGLVLCFWGIAILYTALVLSKIETMQLLMGIGLSFFLIRAGYRIIQKYPII